jgi:hypothetical protein
MQKEDAFDSVRTILRSARFIAQSFQEKTKTLDQILKTGEISEKELSTLIAVTL